MQKLVGSEKQIAWAEKIRANIVDEYNQLKFDGKLNKNNINEIDRMFDQLVSNPSASWWIDNRTRRVLPMLKDIYIAEKDAQQKQPSAPADDNNPEAQDSSATVCPENWNNRGEARVSIADNEVSVRYQKDDEFRAVVKSLGYAWDANESSWTKKIGLTTGSAEDRAAEVANKLLSSGFAVNVPDGKIREAAINASFAPEHRRWIVLYKDVGITIEIEYGHDDIYQAARKISGAKWVRGYGVVVPADSFAEIRDFADICDYRLTPGTEQALKDAEDAHNQKLGGAVKVSSPVVPEQKSASEKLEEKLNVPGVIDDLRDDN